jgi:hypothetical protein
MDIVIKRSVPQKRFSLCGLEASRRSCCAAAVGLASEVELVLFAVFDPRLELQNHYVPPILLLNPRWEETWSGLETFWDPVPLFKRLGGRLFAKNSRFQRRVEKVGLTLKEGVPCGLHFLYNDAGFWLESMAITKSATKRSRNLRAAESV